VEKNNICIFYSIFIFFNNYFENEIFKVTQNFIDNFKFINKIYENDGIIFTPNSTLL